MNNCAAKNKKYPAVFISSFEYINYCGLDYLLRKCFQSQKQWYKIYYPNWNLMSITKFWLFVGFSIVFCRLLFCSLMLVFLPAVLRQSQLLSVLDEFTFLSLVALLIILPVASILRISFTDCERFIFGVPGRLRCAAGVYCKKSLILTV